MPSSRDSSGFPPEFISHADAAGVVSAVRRELERFDKGAAVAVVGVSGLSGEEDIALARLGVEVPGRDR